MKTKGIKQYLDYVSKAGDRFDIFDKITEQYAIKRALYPGSYVHITPSLIIPEVYYVDTDKKAIRFFREMNEIIEFIETSKIYSEKCRIQFEPIDYWQELSIPPQYVDLLISQFAGFVSKACQKYLKIGGILLANDSHGDATMAHSDDHFALIGILKYVKGKYQIESNKLESYFKQRNGKPVDMEKVQKTMKGPKYSLAADYYIFRKVKD